MISIFSNILVVSGILFMLFGTIGLFRFKDFYARILIAANIDTMGVLTLLLGLALRHGVDFFTGKLLLIGVIMLVLNPLVAHVLVRSAHK